MRAGTQGLTRDFSTRPPGADATPANVARYEARWPDGGTPPRTLFADMSLWRLTWVERLAQPTHRFFLHL